MKARLGAAGLIHGTARPDPPAPAGGDAVSARAAAARSRSRARDRGDRQRQALLPLGWVFIAVVVTASVQAHPAPGLRGAGLAVLLALAVYALAVAVALALTVGLTEHPAVQSAITAALVCLLLAVTGQFIRRGRQSQDRTELLLAQLQDARDAEAAAAAVAERGRIAGELHDVLAHSLSGLAIQLQGARKLAEREQVSAGLRAAIDRSADLAKAGLADARQAVGTLRGDQLPTLDQLADLVADFRRDTGADATLRIDGTRRPLPAEASLALFRGVQEALTNTVRYAPGASVSITLRYQPGRTLLAVEDHACPEAGTGPAASPRPPALAGAGGGHGLAAMRERAQRAGGTARAGPTAAGWLVELEVPA